jgi:putative endopeptidase
MKLLLSIAGAGLMLALGQGPGEPRSGLDLAAFDRSIRPQDDLFRFANGMWLRTMTIPADRVTAGALFELTDKVEQDLRVLIEQVPADSRPGSPERQIRDLYESAVNEARLEALGWNPIRPQLERIDAARTTREMAAEAGALSAAATGGPFAASLSVDARDPGLLVVHVTQGGILLPDRNYYVDEAPRFSAIREAYLAYLTRIFGLIDRPAPASDAKAVMALETELARILVSPSEIPSSGRSELRMTLSRLASEMPGFDWAAWARPQGLDRAHAIVLAQPEFFRAFAALVPEQPLESWKAWLVARHVTATAPFLSETIADARFEFFGRVLSGQEQPRARWKRGVALVSAHLGDAIGRKYVERHFPQASKDRVERIVDNVVKAYRAAITDSPWMTTATKREALDKLARMRIKVGYPDRWRTYGDLEIRADDLVGNVLRAQRFEAREHLTRVTRPGSAGYWFMTPQTVNSYYSPSANEMVVPAAMLQPPLFTADADDAVNYGAIGALIGHDVGHAFDTRGREIDALGNLEDWWTADDERAFEQRTRLIVEQFDGFSPVEGVRVSGSRTLAENIGDLAGLCIAYRAYHLAIGRRDAPVIDGFTGDQRFFLGWAQVWRTAVRDEYLRQWVLSNQYAPPEYRANGPVSHLEAFYRAFDVRPSDRMYRPPEKRARLW